MTTDLLFLALALVDGDGMRPDPPPGMDDVAHGRLWAFAEATTHAGIVIAFTIWEKLPDERGDLGPPECLLDFRTRIGLGRGVYVRGSGTFEDPLWILPPNRGVGTMTCVRVSPRIVKSHRFDEGPEVGD